MDALRDDVPGHRPGPARARRPGRPAVHRGRAPRTRWRRGHRGGGRRSGGRRRPVARRLRGDGPGRSPAGARPRPRAVGRHRRAGRLPRRPRSWRWPGRWSGSTDRRSGAAQRLVLPDPLRAGHRRSDHRRRVLVGRWRAGAAGHASASGSRRGWPPTAARPSSSTASWTPCSGCRRRFAGAARDARAGASTRGDPPREPRPAERHSASRSAGSSTDLQGADAALAEGPEEGPVLDLADSSRLPDPNPPRFDARP